MNGHKPEGVRACLRRTARETASVTGRKERTVRCHVQQIFEKRKISRQVDLVRQLLSLDGPPEHPR